MLLGVYLEINQAGVARLAVAFDRKASAGEGFELHYCGDMWGYFGVYIVTVEMQHIGFVAGPVQFNLVALAHANRALVGQDFAMLYVQFKPLDRSRVICRY